MTALAHAPAAAGSSVQLFVVPTQVTRVPELPDRELQVLVGISFGHTNRQIGNRLFISEDTVKTHARRLFRKLGVTDRAHAVRVGLELGILTPLTPLRTPVTPPAEASVPRLFGSSIPATWMRMFGPEHDRHTAACFAARSCPCHTDVTRQTADSTVCDRCGQRLGYVLCDPCQTAVTTP